MKNESFGKQEQMLKHGELASKYRSKDSTPVAERDEDMFEAAAMRADDSLKSSGMKSKDIRGSTTREAIDRKDIDRRLEESVTEEMEVMTADEMLEGIVGKMRNVSSKLSSEESIARDIHKMGAEVSQSTRDRIKALDEKQKALITLHKNAISPHLMAAFKAKGRGEDLLLPKPAEWDALMSDEEVIELKPSMQKRPSSIELQTKEAQLREEAGQTENMLQNLIDEVNAQSVLERTDNPKLQKEGKGFKDFSKPLVESHMNDLYRSLRKTRDQIRDIEINLGMVRRLEG